MFHGCMVALVTPMLASGKVDYDALTKLVEWHLAAGTAGLVLLGTTGEAATLYKKEKLAIIAHVQKHVREQIPIIVGSHANGTQQTVDLTFEMMETGIDACLIMTPAYIKPTQEGLYKHYATIADKVALPQILYNVPSRTACDLLPETLARLGKWPNIIGIKEATGQVERCQQIHALCGDGIDIYSGDDMTAKALMLAGAKGGISVTANVAPEAMRALCDAALEGDQVKADALDARLQPLHNVLFVESNPIPCKWALQEMGMIGEGIRLPMTPLSAAQQPAVRQVLEQLNIL